MPVVPAPDVSVIICAYTTRRWAAIEAAVRSVEAQPVNCELILVIDHEADLLRLARERFAEHTVVPNSQPQGLSGARNTGVAHAVAPIVAFLDDDARAEASWLAALLPHYADPDVMGVGGAALPDWEGSEPSWFPAEFRWVVGCSYTGLPTRADSVRNFIGANMSYRREVFDEVGGFAADLGRVGNVPLGCEETEFGIRVRRRFPTARFVYEPAAQVQHLVGQERGTWTYYRRRCWAEGLSKAVVARLSGQEAALETERRYVRKVLPAGVAAGLRDGAGDGGWRRAGAIVGGLAVTSAGYAYGRTHSSASQALAARAQRRTVGQTSATNGVPR